MFTVLSGQEVELPFRSRPEVLRSDEDAQEWNLSIRRDTEGATSRLSEGCYLIARDWRIIATMNTFDRSHLFQMSAAFVRRFAVVNVPVPTAAELDGWLRARDLEPWVVERIRKLVVLLENERPLGPAIIKDVVDYLAVRLAATPDAKSALKADVGEEDGASRQPEQDPSESSEDPFLEAVIAFILPQMDGVDASALRQIQERLRDVVAKSSSAELDRQFRDLFRI